MQKLQFYMQKNPHGNSTFVNRRHQLHDFEWNLTYDVLKIRPLSTINALSYVIYTDNSYKYTTI